MKVKYGEIFVKHNTEDLWTNASLWLGYDEETINSEDTTIIVEFDDKDIREVSNKSTNSNVNIEFKNDKYIIKRGDKDNVYFAEEPHIGTYGKRSLGVGKIFKNYKYYDAANGIASSFTCIYCKHNVVDGIVKKLLGFSLIRIKSSISSPRYQMAYNSDEFSKDEILCLINCIFRQPSQL